MPFSSIDDLVSSIHAGKSFRYDWNKIIGSNTYFFSRWYELSSLNGSPGANAWAGTALNWVSCNEAGGNGTQIFGIPHGGDVSPETKHVLDGSATGNGGSSAPSLLMLVDLQGYYPGINMNSNSVQNLVGTPTLRYTNGEGVRAFLSSTDNSGGTSHDLSMSYTNSAGTSGRTLPFTVSCATSAIPTHIVHASGGANTSVPFLPLANGDLGVRSVQSVTLSAASGSGTAALCLVKPLLTIPLLTIFIASERDFLNHIPSLPEIKPGACLVWLLFAGVTISTSTCLHGSLVFGRS